MELSDTLRQTRRARLQDVGRLHLEDSIVPDRADAAPPGPAADPVTIDPFSAPRGEDHLRIASRDFRRFDDSVTTEARVHELRENRRAAGDLHELLHPPDARDQRVVPFLEECP